MYGAGLTRLLVGEVALAQLVAGSDDVRASTQPFTSRAHGCAQVLAKAIARCFMGEVSYFTNEILDGLPYLLGVPRLKGVEDRPLVSIYVGGTENSRSRSSSERMPMAWRMARSR